VRKTLFTAATLKMKYIWKRRITMGNIMVMGYNDGRHVSLTFGYVLKAPRQTFPAEIVRTGSITMATKGSWKF
jgi:hypothetical protein